MAINRNLPDLGLQMERPGGSPLYQQIRRQIEAAIGTGQLPAGFRLPPERNLARALGVNRSTVLAAYRELKADGLISGHVGRGTAVLSPQERVAAGFTSGDGQGGAGSVWEPLARGGPAMNDPLLRDLLDLERPGVISLGIGLPGRELLPLDDLRAVQEAILDETGADAFLHSPTEGTPTLRDAVAAWVQARGARCTAAQVLVTTGSQQGLDLISRVFLAPGDVVVMEDPGYLGAILTFRRAGARILGVPVDREGMRVDAVERVLARQRPKLIYTVPTFQNPTGTEMSLARREHLLALAARHQVPVLEEDAYSELRYEGIPLPSLLSLDRAGCVLHLATSSKLLFPGLRVGWLVGPEAALRPLAYAKQTADLHTSTWAQLVVARFASEGRLERHLKHMRREYARRRNTLAAALEKAQVPDMSFDTPRGGFYVWCRLPAGISVGRLMTEAARERVSFLPGAMFSPGGEGSGFVRLNFSGVAPDRLREGIARLSRALAAAGSEPPTARRGAEASLRPIV